MRRPQMFLPLILAIMIFAQPLHGQDVTNPFEDGAIRPTPVLERPPSTGELSLVEASGPGTLVSPARKYIVKPGDTLVKIAKAWLGVPNRFWEIVNLNAVRYPSLKKNPNLIYSGWELDIPGIPSSAGEPENQTETPMTNHLTNQPAAAGRPPVLEQEENPVADSTRESGDTLITRNSRVLLIGDSHTVGIYGVQMDHLLRGTGAKVQSYGVSGSSPSWWWNGTVTKSGYFSRDDKGRTDRPADWRTPRQTPILSSIIDEFHPGIVIVSLGANLLGATESKIAQDCRRLIEIAGRDGARIIWVGPPKSREDAEKTRKKEALNEALKNVTGTNGIPFIDSRPLTRYPATGGDGLHYWGTEGTKTATAWANQVFSRIQGISPR